MDDQTTTRTGFSKLKKRIEKCKAVLIILFIFVCGLYYLYSFVEPRISQFVRLQIQDKLLCIESSPESYLMMLDFTNYTSCPTKGLVTVEQGGRLGNMIWEAASVWGFAEHYGYSAYLPDCIKYHLNLVFDNINIPSLANVIGCDINLQSGRTTKKLSRPDTLRKKTQEWISKAKDHNTVIILNRYIVLFEVIIPRLQKLREMLKFRSEIVKEKDDTMKKILKELSGTLLNSTNVNDHYLKRSEVTIVGVHVRRTDYKEYLARRINKTLAEPEYFFRAMQYFRSKYGTLQTIVFVVVSDDPKWCTEHLLTSPDVIVAPSGKSGSHDLSLLSSCNHSIIDYGTYGMTAAFLAGGETIVYNLGGHLAQTMAKMIPTWTVLE